MARPRHIHPTPAELEVLEVLWQRGPVTARDVLTALDARRPRAYTSVTSLLSVMVEKGLVKRGRVGRAFVYTASAVRENTLGGLAGDLLSRAFKGSASALVTKVLDEAQPSAEELLRIRSTIDRYLAQHGED